MVKRKYYGVQALRALAAVLVVFAHSRMLINGLANSFWRENHRADYPFFLEHFDVGVDIFFCISGFVMCMLVRNSIGGTRAASSFLLSRLIRIFPIYLFFASIVVIVFYASKGTFNVGALTGHAPDDIAHILLSLLLIPSSYTPVLPVAWTLMMEMIFYYICAASLLLKRNNYLMYIYSALALTTVLITYINREGYFIYVINPYYLEFLLGICAYQYREKLMKFFPVMQIVLAFFAFFIVSHMMEISYGWSDRVFIQDNSFSLLVRAFGYGSIGFLLINGVSGVYEKYNLNEIRPFRFMSRLGDASYSLYLLHWFILSPAGKLIARFHSLPLGWVYVWYFFMIVVNIPAAILFAEYIEFPVHNFLGKYFRKQGWI